MPNVDVDVDADASHRVSSQERYYAQIFSRTRSGRVREAEEECAHAYALLRWVDHVNEDIVK
jgi:hypothetical protein